MMANSTSKKTIAALVVLLVLTTAATGTAGLCDWLLCRPASCMTWGPTCYPSGHGLGGCSAPRGYSPAYHAGWQRVPVTVYRPAASRNLLTGTAITTLAPCNTFEWQPRRTQKLLTRHRPIYWRSYNTLYQQPAPTFFRPQCGTSRAASPPAVTEQPATPYYERSDVRLVPAPAGESTEGRARIDPNFRVPREASTHGRTPNGRFQVSATPLLRGMSESRPQPRGRLSLLPPRRLPSAPVLPGAAELVPVSWPSREAAINSADRLQEAWDDSGWVSAP